MHLPPVVVNSSTQGNLLGHISTDGTGKRDLRQVDSFALHGVNATAGAQRADVDSQDLTLTQFNDLRFILKKKTYK